MSSHTSHTVLYPVNDGVFRRIKCNASKRPVSFGSLVSDQAMQTLRTTSFHNAAVDHNIPIPQFQELLFKDLCTQKQPTLVLPMPNITAPMGAHLLLLLLSVPPNACFVRS